MNKPLLGLCFSVVLLLVSCQSSVNDELASDLSLDSPPIAFEVRHLTRISFHQDYCRCVEKNSSNVIFVDCPVGMPPLECQCSVLSEDELKEVVLEDLRSSKGLLWTSVEIIHGTLLLHGDDMAVGKVSELLDSLYEDCE